MLHLCIYFLNETSNKLVIQEDEGGNVALTGRHMHSKTYIHPIFRPVTAQYGKWQLSELINGRSRQDGATAHQDKAAGRRQRANVV